MLKETLLSAQETTSHLPEPIRTIVRALESEKDLKPSHVIRVVREAGVEPGDLREWADFDHLESDSYGRKLVYQGGNFEIMVMSWRPGDFSAIHDHGHTQWGAVQIFGPAEHATFRVEDGDMTTLARWTVDPGDIVGVGHSLVHQMGNPTNDKFFLSLHVYGSVDPRQNITGDARLFDLRNNSIQRVDGGVFFALPEAKIKAVEPGPEGDFPTRLRHMVELIRRLRRMEQAGIHTEYQDMSVVVEDAFSSGHHKQLMRCLEANTDSGGHSTNSMFWRVLNRELYETAKLQNALRGEQRATDRFHNYARLYDALVGQPCMDSFMRRYLLFFAEKYNVATDEKTVISLGCGTGLAERFLIEEMGIAYDNLYGIDISEAMVQEARRRIRADVGNVLTLDPSVRMWDVAFSGLNVFQYLPHDRLQEAIQKTAAIIQPGGYFIGDFITPDHIRWYPNVAYSEDKKVISLRTPRLIEEDGIVFQESEITNINLTGSQMRVTYAGKHRRFLPPMHRVRMYFEKAFGGTVELYDAVSLQAIPEWADSCASTRYVVVAKKK